jgi:exonuclease V gamma subunit
VFAVGWPIVKKVATRRLAKNRSTALFKRIRVGETNSAALGSGKAAPKPTLKQPSNRSFIMLQASEIQKRFTHLEQTIGKASQACHADTTLPKDLMDCVNQLDKQSATATKIAKSKDENRIRQWVDDLEQVGGRAEKACQSATNVDAKVKTAVTAVHAELSDLKKQLH